MLELLSKVGSESVNWSDHHLKPHARTCFTLKLGIMRRRFSKVVEKMSRRGTDLCCMQEVRQKGAFSIFITGEQNRYKLF